MKQRLFTVPILKSESSLKFLSLSGALREKSFARWAQSEGVGVSFGRLFLLFVICVAPCNSLFLMAFFNDVSLQYDTSWK